MGMRNNGGQSVINPLFDGMARVLKRVDGFKKLAREFYFEVILSVHQ